MTVTPVRIPAIPVSAPEKKSLAHGAHVAVVVCEIAALVALITILTPLARDIRWSDAGRLLSASPDLRDASVLCQRFIRETDSLRSRTATPAPADTGSWSWVRLDDGRFRIQGYMDGRMASGKVQRTRYQCDLAPLTSSGRWRLDRLLLSREPIG